MAHAALAVAPLVVAEAVPASHQGVAREDEQVLEPLVGGGRGQQRVRYAEGGLGDHHGVALVGLDVSGEQLRGPVGCDSGQVSDLEARRAWRA